MEIYNENINDLLSKETNLQIHETKEVGGFFFSILSLRLGWLMAHLTPARDFHQRLERRSGDICQGCDAGYQARRRFALSFPTKKVNHLTPSQPLQRIDTQVRQTTTSRAVAVTRYFRWSLKAAREENPPQPTWFHRRRMARVQGRFKSPSWYVANHWIGAWFFDFFSFFISGWLISCALSAEPDWSCGIGKSHDKHWPKARGRVH